MASGRARGGSKLTANSSSDVNELLYLSDVLESFWAPDSSTSFHSSETMVNFEGDCGGSNANKTFFHTVGEEEEEEEEVGEVEDFGGSCFPLSGRKRRLTAGQVELLERNFVVENKLEPERKVQIAKELGLQPRQVAIWFQNRRARFKTKQLEKDYDSLKASHDNLRDNYECLLKENERLKIEVMSLKEKLLMGDAKELPEVPPEVFMEISKQQEDASSAKSDVLDSENFTEPGNSSHGFEPENSDELEEGSLQKSLLAPLLHLPKLEDGYHHDPPVDYACNFGLSSGEEDQPFWHWPY